MAWEEEAPPESPTAIGMSTGMDVPGLENVRGPLEEVLATGRPLSADQRYALDREEALALSQRDDAMLDAIPGQSGAEGLGALPHSEEDDPYDGS